MITIKTGNPGFQAKNPLTGKSTIYLPESPTVLAVKHELSHWLDCRKLGIEKYSKLSRFEKEKMVLDRLKQNRMWDKLNKREKDFSIEYVEDLLSDNVLKNRRLDVN